MDLVAEHTLDSQGRNRLRSWETEAQPQKIEQGVLLIRQSRRARRRTKEYKIVGVCSRRCPFALVGVLPPIRQYANRGRGCTAATDAPTRPCETKYKLKRGSRHTPAPAHVLRWLRTPAVAHELECVHMQNQLRAKSSPWGREWRSQQALTHDWASARGLRAHERICSQRGKPRSRWTHAQMQHENRQRTQASPELLERALMSMRRVQCENMSYHTH